MIFKEENIMLLMLLENLTQDEWKRISDERRELGYCLIDSVADWSPTVRTEQYAVKKGKAARGVR